MGSGPEERVGGSSVFEPLVRGGQGCKTFQLPMGVGHPVFFKWNTFDTTDNRGNSFQFQKTKTF